MKLKTRRILLTASIILFLLIFPLVVLHSFGYRYDLNEKKLIRTGIIYITSTPQDNIKIFINGIEEKEKLNIKGVFKKDYVLYNLMPQTYDIRISKDGYFSWEKRLAVSPGLTTYARPLLLPIDPKNSLILEDAGILNWSISPDFKKIAYLKKEKKGVYFSTYNIEKKTANSILLNDIDPEIDKNLFLNPGAMPNIRWSTGSNIVLEFASDPPLLIALSVNDNKITLIGKFQPDAKIINAEWNQNNTSYIFQTGQQTLYHINILPNFDIAVKIADNVSGFTLKNNTVYYLDTKNMYFYAFSLNNSADKKQFSLEPLKNNGNAANISAPNIQVIISNKSDIGIIDSEKNLYIIKQNSGVPVHIGNDVNTAEFSDSGDYLLYSSSFEIYTYGIEDKTKNIITRLAQKVEKVVWYKDYEHIWFINDGALKIIETDSPPILNVFDFIKFSAPPQHFAYDSKTNTIYYDQAIDNKISIHQLTVEN